MKKHHSLEQIYLYNRGMSRAFLSAAGGVLIPICYLVVASTLSDYFRNNSLSGILGMPVAWPGYLFDLFYNDPDAWYPPIYFFITLYGGNFLLYSLLTYAILRWRGVPKHLP